MLNPSHFTCKYPSYRQNAGNIPTKMDSDEKIPLVPGSLFITGMNFQVNPLIILTIQMRLFLFKFLEKQNGRSSLVPDQPLRRKTDEERSRFIQW
jgi:hypothetical protein